MVTNEREKEDEVREVLQTEINDESNKKCNIDSIERVVKSCERWWDTHA
jgi:hypothetical protein